MGESEEKPKRIERPNLRGIDQFSGQKKVLILGCILVGLYMYPTIVRPFFQIGFSTSEDDSEERREMLNKTRPSFMPEWSSPFAGPKRDD